MPLDDQWSALYRLFYKRDVRKDFFDNGTRPVKSLSDSDVALLQGIGAERLEHVVALHQRDIGANWYQPRVPATWLALQSLLDFDEEELVASLTNSPAFEDRIDDDSNGQALMAFIKEQISRSMELATTGPWLPDLLRYELYLAGKLNAKPAEVAHFEYAVGGIREALLEQALCPDGECPEEYHSLFVRNSNEIAEVALDRDQAEVVRGIIAGESVTRISQRLPQLKIDDVTSIHEECRNLLDSLSADFLDAS